MPLVRIDVLRGRSEAELAAIGAAIHRALGECLGVPERDHFRIAQYLTMPRDQWK